MTECDRFAAMMEKSAALKLRIAQANLGAPWSAWSRPANGAWPTAAS